jgi:hypothetical protein
MWLGFSRRPPFFSCHSYLQMMYLLSCIFIARMINNIETSRNKSKRVGVRAIDKTMIGVSSAAIMQNTGYVVVVVGFIIVFHVNFDEFSSLLSVI